MPVSCHMDIPSRLSARLSISLGFDLSLMAFMSCCIFMKSVFGKPLMHPARQHCSRAVWHTSGGNLASLSKLRELPALDPVDVRSPIGHVPW